jgi:hypothetical protein
MPWILVGKVVGGAALFVGRYVFSAFMNMSYAHAQP